MLIPLSWLKEYVDIKMPFPELATKLSEAGLTVELWKEEGGDIIFDPEVTPNRPDWLSVYGVAREISAVTGAKLKPLPTEFKATSLKPKSPKFDITIKPNFEIVPRITTVLIRGVKVKSSPDWLQKRIKQIGLRPINNLVDITNYVLWTHGSLLHSFDYDKIRGHQMTVELAKGGEDFRSLDGISYSLPKDAIIIKDLGRVIDLLPIKGGENTATTSETKNILLHSVVVDPVLTRRTSQALGLRSDSSKVAERGLDPNGTVVAVNHALKLILELAGGEIASELMDLKEKEFKPWSVDLRHKKLESVLGIEVEPKKVNEIFSKLELKASGEYKVEIPTFRPDIKIEEDLIEEVGRIIGYNSFPKTLPQSAVPTVKVEYFKDYDFEYKVKQTLKGLGYSEIYTYSLIPESQLIKLGENLAESLRIKNPISKDYEYLRPHLLGSSLDALHLNLPNFKEVKLFELGKVYKGKNLDKFKEENNVAGIVSGARFFETKGEVEALLNSLGISYEIQTFENVTSKIWLHPGRAALITSGKDILGNIGEVHPSLLGKFNIKTPATRWYLEYELLEKLYQKTRKYHPIPKYPNIIEDITLVIPEKVSYGEVVDTIKKESNLIESITLLDTHEDNKTLRIKYLDRSKNLTEKEVAEIRSKFLKKLKELGVKLKD